MTEAQFQRRVTDMAERFGWKVWHVPAPMRWAPTNKAFVPAREAAGLPDLIMLHDDPPRLIFAELKGDKGKLSEAQVEFLESARKVADDAQMWDEMGASFGSRNRIGVYAWRPDDEPAIEQLLRSKVVT